MADVYERIISDTDTDSAYPVNFEAQKRPGLLFAGPLRAGKTSIQKVLFYGKIAYETVFEESTTTIEPYFFSQCPLLHFPVCEIPGNYDPKQFDRNAKDAQKFFRAHNSIVYVIDVNSTEKDEAIDYLFSLLHTAYKYNKSLTLDILLHQVDNDKDDPNRMEVQRLLHSTVSQRLKENNISIPVTVHLTSIYDYSLWEVMSSIVHKKGKEIPFLEQLLNSLITNSNIERALLYDIHTKLVLATDGSPVDKTFLHFASQLFQFIHEADFVAKDNKELSQAIVKIKSAIYKEQILYVYQITQQLSIVAVIQEDNFRKKGVIDFNLNVVGKAINQMMDPRRKIRLSF